MVSGIGLYAGFRKLVIANNFVTIAVNNIDRLPNKMALFLRYAILLLSEISRRIGLPQSSSVDYPASIF